MLPIAEKFISIQGEGQYAGTRMFFIRLAGCSVGRGTWPFTCTAWNGREFRCDTDYRKHGSSTVSELVSEVKESGLRHVCITGGEPLMHKDIDGLVERLRMYHIMPHIETSVTIILPGLWPGDTSVPWPADVHLTVAPK